MNPVYVLDLGFVLPLMGLASVRLLARRPAGVRLAVPPSPQTATRAGNSDWSTRWLKDLSSTSSMQEKLSIR